MKKRYPLAINSSILEKHGIYNQSYTNAVFDIKDMKLKKIHSLLNDIIEPKVTLPTSIIMLRLIAMYLVQKDRKFAIENIGESGLIPFNEFDYNEALEYAEKNYQHWKPVEVVEKIDSETGEVIVENNQKKKKKSGGTYEKVVEFMNKNKDLKPKYAAKQIHEEYNIAENTALVYVYKWRKENG